MSIPFIRILPHTAGPYLPVARRPSDEEPSAARPTEFEIQEESDEPGTQSTTSEAQPEMQPQTSSSPGPSDYNNGGVNESSSLLRKGDSRSPRDPLIDGDDTTQDARPNILHSDIRGLAMLSRLEFWQLFLIMALLSGIGLMTIKYVPSRWLRWLVFISDL